MTLGAAGLGATRSAWGWVFRAWLPLLHCGAMSENAAGLTEALRIAESSQASCWPCYACPVSCCIRGGGCLNPAPAVFSRMHVLAARDAHENEHPTEKSWQPSRLCPRRAHSSAPSAQLSLDVFVDVADVTAASDQLTAGVADAYSAVDLDCRASPVEQWLAPVLATASSVLDSTTAAASTSASFYTVFGVQVPGTPSQLLRAFRACGTIYMFPDGLETWPTHGPVFFPMGDKTQPCERAGSMNFHAWCERDGQVVYDPEFIEYAQIAQEHGCTMKRVYSKWSAAAQQVQRGFLAKKDGTLLSNDDATAASRNARLRRFAHRPVFGQCYFNALGYALEHPDVEVVIGSAGFRGSSSAPKTAYWAWG